MREGRILLASIFTYLLTVIFHNNRGERIELIAWPLSFHKFPFYSDASAARHFASVLEEERPRPEARFKSGGLSGGYEVELNEENVVPCF